MYNFQSIKELLNALVLGKELLGEMFSKRKAFDYRFDQAVELIEENKVEALIEKGLLIRNGRFLEIEDQLLTFFEQILDVNEEINVSLINEQITLLKDNIDYYLAEDSDYRQHKYMKVVKSSLRKIGYICLRNVIDVHRNIDNTFKTEPNYRIKIKKLENYDQRTLDIKKLILLTEQLLSQDELTFFATAKDDELSRITIDLQSQLQSADHNLIEMQKQIIKFLNQVKYQSKVIEKIRQVKYLKDQFELESKSDVIQQLDNENLVAFESRTKGAVKLSLDLLHKDETYEIIQSLNKRIKSDILVKVPVAKSIDSAFFTDTVERNVFVDMEKMKATFSASGYHLLDFVLQYDYPRELDFEEMVSCYCQLISLFEDNLQFTDEYINYKGTEFSVVYPS